jgi:hypothetical protein
VSTTYPRLAFYQSAAVFFFRSYNLSAIASVGFSLIIPDGDDLSGQFVQKNHWIEKHSAISMLGSI